MNTGQSAYSKTVGLPPEAGTADDESGAGAAHQVPYDAGLGMPYKIHIEGPRTAKHLCSLIGMHRVSIGFSYGSSSYE